MTKQRESYRKEMESDYREYCQLFSGIMKQEIFEFIIDRNWNNYLSRKRNMESTEDLKEEIIDSIIGSRYYLAKEYWNWDHRTSKSALSRAANIMCNEFKNIQEVIDYMKLKENDDYTMFNPRRRICNRLCFANIQGIGKIISCDLVYALQAKYID